MTFGGTFFNDRVKQQLGYEDGSQAANNASEPVRKEPEAAPAAATPDAEAGGLEGPKGSVGPTGPVGGSEPIGS
jgi:hypothetical protein